MNARAVTVVAGLITLAFGLASLAYPDRIMGLLGFSTLNTAHPAAVLGEVRATYGGLFAVMGVFTLLAAIDPAAHRARLLFIGLLWLGACAGRLAGVSIDGSPGLPGWAAAVGEFLIGGALVAVSLRQPPRPAVPAAPLPATPAEA